MYNLDSANLVLNFASSTLLSSRRPPALSAALLQALHGIHPHVTHLVVNLPMLFGAHLLRHRRLGTLSRTAGALAVLRAVEIRCRRRVCG